MKRRTSVTHPITGLEIAIHDDIKSLREDTFRGDQQLTFD